MIVRGVVLADRTGHGTDCGRLSFVSRLAGQTLLERAVATLTATPEVDTVEVVTNDRDLAAVGRAVLVPDWFWTYGLAFFSKEHWLLARAVDALAQAGVVADVLLVLGWRTPLVSSRSLERMYHRLLEDRVAARVAGVTPVDPNIYIRLQESVFFPVWGDLGADRQMIPQLYQFAQVGVVRPNRLLSPIPETKGHVLPEAEGLVLDKDDDLDLAAFLLARAKS